MKIENIDSPTTPDSNSNEQIQEINNESINHFTQALQARFKLLKFLLYCSFIVIFLDIICMIKIPIIFFDIINITALLIICICFLYCLYVFRHNFDIVSYYIYKSTSRVIVVLIICLILFYLDMFYLLLFKILLNFENLEDVIDSTFNYVFFSIILFFIYFLVNLIFPFTIFYKLIQIKETVKNLGKAQGQSYDIVPTSEIQMTTIVSETNKN